MIAKKMLRNSMNERGKIPGGKLPVGGKNPVLRSIDSMVEIFSHLPKKD